jgi:hypothetical protein
MMGHSHPSITLQYYVHGMDWLLDTYLRSAPALQPNTRTAVLASGLRERTAFRLAAQGTAVLPARVLRQRWPELATVTRVASEELASWPWKAWDILFRHLSLRESLPPLARDYGLLPDEAIGYCHRATHLYQMRARVRRKRGPRGWQHVMLLAWTEPGSKSKVRVACPKRPHLTTDKKVLTIFAPALARVLEDKPDLLPLLRYYAENIWQHHNQLFFRNPDQPSDAIAYLELLEGMGIKRSQHRFFVFHKLQHCKQLEQWKVALRLPKNVAIHRLPPPNVNSRSYDSWIGIEPILSNSTPARGNNSTGTHGFRFLMLMAYIVYGETDMEQVCRVLLKELDKEPDSPLKGPDGSLSTKEGLSSEIKDFLLPSESPVLSYAERRRRLSVLLRTISRQFPDLGKIIGAQKTRDGGRLDW